MADRPAVILDCMKKVWLIILGVVIVIGIAVAYLLLTGRKAASPQDNAAQTATQQSSQPPETSEANTEQSAAQTPGNYTPYSPDAVTKTNDRKILFFHAPWCPQCRALEKSITSSAIPTGVTIFKVDYDSSTALRQKYGVTIQTTLIEIDKNGNEVQKYVAYSTPNLNAVVEAMKL